MKNQTPFTFDDSSTPEKILIELSFYFSVLIEYQLNDLQGDVREFVCAMSNAIQEMDGLVVAEGCSAQNLYESLFNQSEASNINTRAENRAQEIFGEALKNLHPGQTPLEIFNSDPNVVKKEVSSNVKEKPLNRKEVSSNTKEIPAEESSQAKDKIWSDIAKKFESFCRLEERLRPQVYTMIQSLNFEDIQTQRIEHALNAQKKLNEGIVHFLKKGLQNCSVNEVKEFAENLINQTRASYTMSDERKVFEQVFLARSEKKD